MPARLRRGVLKLHERITGRHVLARLEELERTQWLERNALLELQSEKLQRMLDYAYQYVPYYRRVFDEVGFHPRDLEKDATAFDKIPIMDKNTVRDHFDELITTESGRLQTMSKKSTSGSTGQPLIFMQDSDFRDFVTADIQRHLSWGGWKMGQPHAFIWGALFEPTSMQTLRGRLIDWTWNRFTTNAFLMTDETMAEFAEQLRHRRPPILFGYASSLHRFAQFVREGPYQDITFDAIFSSAEVLLPAVRAFIEEIFECRMFDRYGTLELGGVACECDAHTGLHISAENNYVEILKDGHTAEPGQVGDVVVTNLNNKGMPFIRYSIGDASAWYVGNDCPCGRAAPMIQSVQGRLVDSFRTRDGRSAWAGFAGAGYVGLAHSSIKQFQIVQKSLDLIVVNLVTEGDVPQSVLDGLTKTFQTAFGQSVTVRYEFLDEIPALPSGKHRYAYSELTHKAT